MLDDEGYLKPIYIPERIDLGHSPDLLCNQMDHVYDEPSNE